MLRTFEPERFEIKNIKNLPFSECYVRDSLGKFEITISRSAFIGQLFLCICAYVGTYATHFLALVTVGSFSYNFNCDTLTE